ncbi:MAG TPA: hypothetical protein VE954_31010 [Oligoflexus sp.]|uniref:hypothetical protein n=1 Tax=Oligoflexus sp. TaxID=1971216 RepID=UPI002D5A7D81|nr:hypothetical protein [Oligoflexus sp.]HYX37555.1 hypothetical protein [Oligoflexus sp.]
MLRTLCNRRRVLALSSLSLGGLLLGSSVALGGNDAEMSRMIKDIIMEHYPKAREQETMVDQFIRDLLAQKVDSLEPKPFLKQAASKSDKSDLERYVIVQFMTSPGFIALQDK